MPASPRAEHRRHGGRWGPWLLTVPGLVWLVGLYLLPLAALVPLSLSQQVDRFSLRAVFQWRLATYAEVVWLYGPILLRSFAYAGSATALGLVIAYPLAGAIRFLGGRRRPLLLALVVLPFFTSYLVRAIAFTTLLGDQGPLLELARRLAWVEPLTRIGVLQNGHLLHTPAAVILGLTYNMLPYLVLPLVVAMERIEPHLLEAAADLHASPLGRFWRVVWPLSRPGLNAALLLSLIPAAGDVVNPRFLGGPNQQMIANTIENLLLVQLQAPRAAALTLLLMALITLGVWRLRRGSAVELPLP